MTVRAMMERDLRRAVESDDLVSAQEIAVKLSHFVEMDLDEDDRHPDVIPGWGVES